MSHPLKISHRIQQLAVKIYRRDTAELKGEAKEEAMQEMAEKTQETLQDAVDQLSLDLEFFPMKFLNKFALYPDTLNSIISTVLTISFAMFQQHFVDPVKAENKEAAGQ